MAKYSVMDVGKHLSILFKDDKPVRLFIDALYVCDSVDAMLNEFEDAKGYFSYLLSKSKKDKDAIFD